MAEPTRPPLNLGGLPCPHHPTECDHEWSSCGGTLIGYLVCEHCDARKFVETGVIEKRR